MDNFVVALYKYGKLVVNKNCNLQLSTILETGETQYSKRLQPVFLGFLLVSPGYKW